MRLSVCQELRLHFLLVYYGFQIGSIQLIAAKRDMCLQVIYFSFLKELTDKARKFHPTSVSLSNGETEEHYETVLRGLIDTYRYLLHYDQPGGQRGTVEDHEKNAKNAKNANLIPEYSV